MDITKTIKMMMLQRDVKQIDVANKMEYTKQGFNKLLSKNNYKIDDVVRIADILNYDVQIKFVDRIGCEDIIAVAAISKEYE